MPAQPIFDSAEALDDTACFELFWRNSELTAATARAFGARINAYAPTERPLPRLAWSQAASPLDMPRDVLQRHMDGRASTRVFSDTPLTSRALGRVLAACRRGAYASAGGLHPLEVFAIACNVDGAYAGQIVHYDPVAHAATPRGPAPDWATLDATCNSGFATPPAALLVFTLHDAEQLEKYGERGGRFGLIEVGHAAQNVALRLAADGLAGCELGGACDDDLIRVLGLRPGSARVALAFAIGHAAARPHRSRLRRR